VRITGMQRCAPRPCEDAAPGHPWDHPRGPGPEIPNCRDQLPHRSAAASKPSNQRNPNLKNSSHRDQLPHRSAAHDDQRGPEPENRCCSDQLLSLHRGRRRRSSPPSHIQVNAARRRHYPGRRGHARRPGFVGPTSDRRPAPAGRSPHRGSHRIGSPARGCGEFTWHAGYPEDGALRVPQCRTNNGWG
jgi:hypothetical protein